MDDVFMAAQRAIKARDQKALEQMALDSLATQMETCGDCGHAVDDHRNDGWGACVGDCECPQVL